MLSMAVQYPFILITKYDNSERTIVLLKEDAHFPITNYWRAFDQCKRNYIKYIRDKINWSPRKHIKYYYKSLLFDTATIRV